MPIIKIARGLRPFVGGGGGSAPAWLNVMDDKTWAALASSATVAAVAPSPDPGSTGGGQFGVMAAWGGAAVDTDRQSLVIPAQGGHSNYYGNEVYELLLNVAIPAWARVLNTRYTFSGADDGLMDDGSPCSHHGNSHVCYAANVQRTYIMPLNFTAQVGSSTNKVFRFNAASPAWTQMNNIPGSGLDQGSGVNGGIVYQPSAGYIWLVSAQSDVSLARYNPLTDTYTLYDLAAVGGNTLFTGYSGKLAISSTGLLVYISGSVVGQDGSFKFLDLANISAGWRSPAALTGTPPASEGPGLIWHTASAAFIGWDGSSGNAKVKKLSVPANLSSGTWAWTDISPAGTNAVTPSNRQGNGSFGRFNILENLGGSGRDCLVLVNDVSGPTYVYKLPAAGL